MSKKKSSPRPAPIEPSLAQWEALYEVAGNLKMLAPWRALADTDILVVQLPGQDEPVYCSVMGQGGMSYGITVYPGKDRDVMKQLGLRFCGRNQWIYFRSMKPGQFPWFLDAEQAEQLTLTLQNLAMLCLCYMEGKLKVDFEAGETLARWYDPEKDMWMNAVIPTPMPEMERSLELKDDLLLARLKRSKKTSVRLEADSFYLPLPVQEDKRSPPAGVRLVEDEGVPVLDSLLDSMMGSLMMGGDFE